MNTKQEITISLSKSGSNHYSITQNLSPPMTEMCFDTKV